MPGFRRRPLLGGGPGSRPFRGPAARPAWDAPAVGSNGDAQAALREQPAPREDRSALLDEVSHDLAVFPGFEEAWHQSNDALIANVVADFNAKKGWSKGDPHWLDPNLVKAWALQESGGHEDIYTAGDMMQMNNGGDWAREKEWFGVKKGEKLSPEKSLRAALEWAYYKGEVTRAVGPDGVDAAGDWHATVRGTEELPGYESRFQGWGDALEGYNGGGVADYDGQVQRRFESARVA